MMKAMEKRRNSGESGFTLIELLVVVAILGILAAVAVFAIGSSTGQSKKAACNTDVQTVQTASDAYYVKNNSYAATVATLVTDGFLRSAPSNASYSIAIGATGNVTSTPACSTLG